jgi:hypothetical protein
VVAGVGGAWGGVCDALAVLGWRLRGDFCGEVLECLVERHCEVVYVCGVLSYLTVLVHCMDTAP